MKLTAAQLKRIIKEEAEAVAGAAATPWNTIAHHVTLNMGPWRGEPSALGQRFPIIVTGLAGDDNVLAAKVSLPQGPVGNKPPANPHITVAVKLGVKPAMSNSLLKGDHTTQDLQLSLEGELKDLSSPTGGYTGLILDKNGHNQLVNAVNSLGYTLQPNAEQTPPLAEFKATKQESIRLLKNLIREFID